MQTGALRRILSVTLAMSLVITQTGCVSVPTLPSGGTSSGGTQVASLTPAERKMREDSAKLDAKSSLQGCLAGAAAGALVGMLSGGKRRNNMLIGAAIGCGVGVGANAYIQSKRQQYQYDEQRLQSIIADVRADNERLASLISSSKAVMAADRKKIAAIDKAYRSKSVSLEEARREMASVKANRNHLKHTVGALQEKEQSWQEVSKAERSSGANTAQLDVEITKLRRKVTSLEKEVALMDQQINVSPVAG